MAKNEMNVPEGFVLDSSENIPTGFVLDSKQPDVPQWGRDYPNLYGAVGAARETLGPLVEATGLIGGGIVGGAATPELLGAGSIPGASLGHAGSKNILRQIDIALGNEQPKGFVGTAKKTAEDIATGAALEMGGGIAAKGIEAGISAAGSGVIKPILGRMSGTGKLPIEEAIKSGKETGLIINPLKSSTEFDMALRGKLSSEDIVENAKSALQTIKDNRNETYQMALEKLGQSDKQIDLIDLKSNAYNILKKFVRFNKNGTPDWNRTALGKEGVAKVKEIIKKIDKWGSVKGDATPLGLDLLKRDLDNFYSESSNARAFVTSLRNTVKNKLVKEVPEYATMTKGYEEATNLIKDIESGLMMRKKGMTGRITADQTLRRLMSAMKDNYKLRADLVDVLGNKGGQELTAQIAGNVMRSPLPHGLAGTGPAIVGEAVLAHYVNPAFWPIVVSSSPRVQGEFLRLFGKFAAEAEGTAPIITRLGSLQRNEEN